MLDSNDRKCWNCGRFAARTSYQQLECKDCDVLFWPEPIEIKTYEPGFVSVLFLDHSKGTYYIA